jgi:hypothetical protein
MGVMNPNPGFIPAPGQGIGGQAYGPGVAEVDSLNDPMLDQLAEYTRQFMRDYPELNRLTAGYDHSPRTIKWAIMDTLSDWAATPPFIGQSMDMILRRNLVSVFIRGVVICLMTSLGILHLRNHLSYSDGGVNVQVENPQLIQAWIGMMKAEYEEKKNRILVALNIENALNPGVSGLQSEYYFINSFFGYL